MSDREAEMLHAIQNADLNDDDTAVFVKPKPAREPAQVYSVRIPVERLEQLRRIAAARSTPPSTLMREWVLDRLDEEDAAADSSFTVFGEIVAPVDSDALGPAWSHLKAVGVAGIRTRGIPSREPSYA